MLSGDISEYQEYFANRHHNRHYYHRKPHFLSLLHLYVPPKAEAYNGQVTEGKLYEGEDDADDGDDWFKGPLKFKRHIDDDLRKGSDGRRADDYAVIDPLKQGHGPGRGSDTGRGGGGSRGRGGGSSSRGRSWRDDGGSATRR